MTANTEHKVVKLCQPSDGGIKIWRYMDLPKLVAFLETESLHFARADTLGDPFEGSWTRLNRAAQEQQIREMIADAEMNIPDAKVKYTPEKLQQEFERSMWPALRRSPSPAPSCVTAQLVGYHCLPTTAWGADD